MAVRSHCNVNVEERVSTGQAGFGQVLSYCYVTFGTLFQDGDSSQFYRQKATIMAVLAGVGRLRRESEDLSGYSRAVARPCFRASMRLSKVDLVQLASR